MTQFSSIWPIEKTLLSSIWPIEKTLLSETTPRMGAMAIKEYSAFPRLQYFWSLTIWLFTVKSRILFKGVLPPCSDLVSVFSRPSRLGHSLAESYPSAEIQSVYTVALADWAIKKKRIYEVLDEV